jgi:flavodoxin
LATVLLLFDSRSGLTERLAEAVAELAQRLFP